MQPKRRGLALTIIGALLAFVIAPSVFIIATLASTSKLDAASGFPVVDGKTVVTLTAKEQQLLITSRKNTDCVVSSFTGERYEIESEPASSSGGYSFSSSSGMYSFSVDTTGPHTIECGEGIIVSGNDAEAFKEYVLRNLLIALGVASAIGITGVVLLIVGIVKLVRSGKERKAFQRQNMPAAVGYGQNSGYAPPQTPGYGQPQAPYGQPTQNSAAVPAAGTPEEQFASDEAPTMAYPATPEPDSTPNTPGVTWPSKAADSDEQKPSE